MSTVVTGEAVVLELRPASFAARALGTIIDVTAQLLLLVLLFFLVGNALDGTLDDALTRTLLLVSVVLIFLILPVTVETLSRGKSLGKLIMGLRIVRDDGGAVRFRQAFTRGILAVLEIYMLAGSLAFVTAVFNEKSKRLGDMLAGTYALRERVKAEIPPVVVMPPELAPWAQLADIGRLPDPLSRRVSRFLAQSLRMTPHARASLGESLATEVSAYVSPPPPAGTLPENYLRAVMVQRRERDFARLSAQRERTGTLGSRLHRLPFEDR
ncbi:MULTISPECIES: RDD family protein [Arthrobacter]|uniref:RDD family protein n=1 Tax=Arthrobacter caoxuetaonis TaxID=2886935 RepID=A0A9X1SDY6_9MICC|nr:MULTISPECIES: RDD family protein [Arthrobacter]MCC3282328.1 RDD family protein [Arthrobacter caoxuetaonis]MCC3297284.1 RDD family protein [Arthrobacter caoxuetaonis]MCC9194173.1 RDD family protein [Arthrobacter sp. zg-Y916]USQ58164.1 RDD family protein [Arthrobacter caoxuetaonis]